jgi:hypothetical protein
MVNINPIGLVLTLIGLFAVVWPYWVARFRVTLRAIGSTRTLSEVEPAGWNVMLTRVAGIVITAVGVAVLFRIITV